MTEEITEEQKDLANQAVEDNKNSVNQKAQQLADDQKAKAQAEIDKATQELADAPAQIEENISDMRKRFEAILGKSPFNTPKCDPNSPDFDVNALIGSIQPMIDKVLAMSKPLSPVMGNIPVLGDMSSLFSMLANSAPTSQQYKTANSIDKIPPEIPPGLKNETDKLVESIISASLTVPLLLFNVTFAMFNAVWTCIEQIRANIGVPSKVFPLDLIPDAVKLMPQLITLLQIAPSVSKQAIEGTIKQKMAEAQLLGIPKVTASEITSKTSESKTEKDETVKPTIVQPQIKQTIESTTANVLSTPVSVPKQKEKQPYSYSMSFKFSNVKLKKQWFESKRKNTIDAILAKYPDSVNLSTKNVTKITIKTFENHKTVSSDVLKIVQTNLDSNTTAELLDSLVNIPIGIKSAT